MCPNETPPRDDSLSPKHSVVMAQPVITIRLGATTPAGVEAPLSGIVPLTAVRLSLKPPQKEQSTRTNILVDEVKLVVSAVPSSQSKNAPDSPLPLFRPDREPVSRVAGHSAARSVAPPAP
jgi:hypothetical protein